MGRAIVRNPKVFLMDEPLSNLDAKLRVQMRIEIAKPVSYTHLDVYKRQAVSSIRNTGRLTCT